MIGTVALIYYVGFYGAFLLFQVGHLSNPYALAEAYDVPTATTQASLDAFGKGGGKNDAILLCYLMVTRIEGACWLALASSALFVLLTKADRRPVFVAFTVAGACAGAVHAHHMGFLGPRPAYAIDHPFNMVLLVADSVAAVLGLLSLAFSDGGSKAKPE